MAQVNKVSINRSEAIQQIADLIAEDISGHSRGTIASMVADLLINGHQGYKNMLNLELIQELEGSVFYGQDVEITVVNDLEVGKW
jgi:hypothetical protein